MRIKLLLLLRLALIAAALYVGWVFASRYVAARRWELARARVPAPPSAEFERVYGGTDVRILQFYSPSSVIEGDRTTICYGVVNAAVVRIEPPVEGVSPSLNRPQAEAVYCFAASLLAWMNCWTLLLSIRVAPVSTKVGR